MTWRQNFMIVRDAFVITDRSQSVLGLCYLSPHDSCTKVVCAVKLCPRPKSRTFIVSECGPWNMKDARSVYSGSNSTRHLVAPKGDAAFARNCFPPGSFGIKNDIDCHQRIEI